MRMKNIYSYLRALLMLLFLTSGVGTMWGQDDFTVVASTTTQSNGLQSTYNKYTMTDGWILTYGGNSVSGGTNSNKRSNCNLSLCDKYAVSPDITTSNTAFAIASPATYADVEKVSVSWTGGSNHTRGTLYLLSSSDNITFEKIESKTISATISYDFTFTKKTETTYYALVWKDSDTSGNYRFDNISITLYKRNAPAVTVDVTDVTLDKVSATLTVGETTALTATVSPANATNKSVTWSSNNPSVATVEGGVVTAMSEGEATITVTTEDGNKTATCAITVNSAGSGSDNQITFDFTSRSRIFTDEACTTNASSGSNNSLSTFYYRENDSSPVYTFSH